MLAAQVRRLSGEVLDALYMPADHRVVRRVADLAVLYNTGVEPIDIPIRQEDLASMAGTTRPPGNRVLKQLEDDGVLSVSRGRMEVHQLGGGDRATASASSVPERNCLDVWCRLMVDARHRAIR